jgi:hypothetical protein
MLEVACSRCDRHGRLSVAKLIERAPLLLIPKFSQPISNPNASPTAKADASGAGRCGTTPCR